MLHHRRHPGAHQRQAPESWMELIAALTAALLIVLALVALRKRLS
ncbi:MAG TPA: hypothetical protein VMG41_00015 [Gemmatimonadales bacterium]|nr:hypothetical protein [Gemmatimonadales bacterium]